jgi:hypothetical protein
LLLSSPRLRSIWQWQMTAIPPAATTSTSSVQLNPSSDDVDASSDDLDFQCPPASHCPPASRGPESRPASGGKRPRTLPLSAGGNVDSDRQGRLILAAVVGVPDGRWKREFEEPKSGANAREQLLCLQRGIVADSSSVEHRVGQNVGSLSLHGFMIIRSWAWRNVGSLCPQTLAMITCLNDKHKRSNNIEHLEHRIVTAARLDHPLTLSASGDTPLSALCINLTSDSQFTLSKTASGIGGSTVTGFQALQQRWQRHLRNDKTVHIWEIWTLLAHHIVQGDWRTDLTAVVPRLAATQWRPPVLPARSLLREIRRNRTTVAPPVLPVPPVDVMDIVAEGRRTQRQGCVYAFHHGSLIRAVVGAQHIKKQTAMPKAVVDMIAFALPDQVALVTDRIATGTLSVPKTKTLRASRIRCDVAAMLANRELYRRSGGMFRYLASDASPQAQQSLEIFVSVERVIRRCAIAGKAMDAVSPADIKVRLMPICTLGHNRTDLASKALTQAPDIYLFIMYICVWVNIHIYIAYLLQTYYI